jgi:hypothetical protein
MRVNITLCMWSSHCACEHHTMRVNITLCVWTSHYACEHHTMRVNITLCVLTSHYACEHHTMRVNTTQCVWTPHNACEHHTMRVNIKHVCVFWKFVADLFFNAYSWGGNYPMDPRLILKVYLLSARRLQLPKVDRWFLIYSANSTQDFFKLLLQQISAFTQGSWK